MAIPPEGKPSGSKDAKAPWGSEHPLGCLYIFSLRIYPQAIDCLKSAFPRVQ